MIITRKLQTVLVFAWQMRRDDTESFAQKPLDSLAFGPLWMSGHPRHFKEHNNSGVKMILERNPNVTRGTS